MVCNIHQLKQVLLPFIIFVMASCSSGGGGGESGDAGDWGGSDGSGGGSISSIQISPETILLTIDMERPLVATAYNAAGGVVDAAFAWEISDTRVAGTDVSGTKLTGTGIGETTITARAGGRSASAAVKVVEPVEAKIVLGQRYSCGLTVVGEAWCWGDNNSSGTEAGVLGNENVKYTSALPVQVQGGLLFRDITAGHEHVCGVTTEGKAYCWGRNTYGQLGTDSVATFTSAPVPVKADVKFTAISTENIQTCALTEEGETWCWPQDIKSWWVPPHAESTPSRLPFKLESAPSFVQLGTGPLHACGLTAEGEAWCWGSNHDTGLLGINSVDNQYSDPVQVVGNHKFSTISVGGNTTCALKDGAPWCWGRTVSSMLSSLYQPTAVDTGSYNFVSINVSHRQAFLLDAQGDLYWWGNHFFDFVIADAPELLDDSHNHASLGVGSAMHSMTVTTDGKTTGWGWNQSGQAGLGVKDVWQQSTPTRATEGFSLDVETTSILIKPGKSVRIPISITRHGGFNIYTGGSSNETVSLSALGLPDGVTASFTPPALSGSLTEAELVITASSNASAHSGDISIRASSPGAEARTAAVNVSVPAPPTPAGGGNLNLVCTSESTPMPSGYHCMNNGSGNLVPGKFDIPAMHGTWVDSGIGLCIRWGANGDATARYRAPQLGGGSTEVHNGIWGVISRSSGQPEGSETQWYVFTSPADAQTKLLGYNSVTNNIIGWNFVKSGSCPW